MKERILNNIEIRAGTDCWIWKNCKDRDGYGRVRIGGGKTTGAHRLSYMLFSGEIPKNIKVLHTCDTPSCVNPKHLFLGTHSDNMKDMYNKGRNPMAENYNGDYNEINGGI